MKIYFSFYLLFVWLEGGEGPICYWQKASIKRYKGYGEPAWMAKIRKGWKNNKADSREAIAPRPSSWDGGPAFTAQVTPEGWAQGKYIWYKKRYRLWGFKGQYGGTEKILILSHEEG